MSDPQPDKKIDLGVFGRKTSAPDASSGGIELIAAILTLVWLVLCLSIYTSSDRAAFDGLGGLSMLLVAVGVMVPVLLLWIGALTLRAIRRLAAEVEQLREATTALRQAQLAHQQAANLTRRFDPDVADRSRPQPGAPAAGQPRQSPRPAPPLPVTADGQPQLPLGAPPEPAPDQVPTAELLLALNFPDDADDVAAIAALKRTLQDRDSAKLIRAAQDVLTLLGSDGIYMDALQPDRARPEVWRRFAGGERGRGVAALGGIRDRDALATISARMRQDPVFRDAAHHFLRSFDRYVSTFADRADDAALSTFSETRTAKAFMLIGRVTGTFD